MARQFGFDQRDSGWRDMVWAAVAAALVTLLLIGGVALSWVVGRGPASPPALEASAPHTPTPRALSFARTTPQPQQAGPEEAPANAAATAAPTAAVLAMSLAGDAGDSRSEPIAELSRKADFRQLAAGSWSVSGDTLINPGAEAVAERWIRLASAPNTSIAIEAEMRVSGVLESVCDQSFGIVGGSPEAGPVVGGGVIYPCSGEGPTLRLTDATVWQDGYNGDKAFASEAFDPGDDWQTYRLELRGDAVRLLVDGKEVLTAEPDPAISPTAKDVEVGLWSQGAGVEVRKVTVLPLPEA